MINLAFRLDGSNSCKKFDLKKHSSYFDDEHSIGFVNKYDKLYKIGPSAILSIFKEDRNWIKRDQNTSERGIANSVVYSYDDKDDYFGLEKLKIDLTFKRDEAKNDEAKLIPLKISISGLRGSQKVELTFDYFDFKVVSFDDLASSGYQVAPSIGCPELSGFFAEKKPNFAIDDRMEIEFDDVSSFERVKRERYHLDRTEKIARFENDNVKVLDEKNRIVFHMNTERNEKNCEMELFSSEEAFDKVKKDSFKNLDLFSDLDIGSFTFIGEDVRNGYLRRKFQRITEHGKKTLFFRGVCIGFFEKLFRILEAMLNSLFSFVSFRNRWTCL